MDVEAKGERARRILEDEVFQEAEERAIEKIKDEWASTPTTDGREALWRKLQAVKAMREALEVLKTDGIMHRDRREKRENH